MSHPAHISHEDAHQEPHFALRAGQQQPLGIGQREPTQDVTDDQDSHHRGDEAKRANVRRGGGFP